MIFGKPLFIWKVGSFFSTIVQSAKFLVLLLVIILSQQKHEITMFKRHILFLKTWLWSMELPRLVEYPVGSAAFFFKFICCVTSLY